MRLPQWLLSKELRLLSPPRESISLRTKQSFTSSTCSSSRKRLDTSAGNGRDRELDNNDDSKSERDLLLSVLSASTTRRDAKSYLSRFQPLTADLNNATDSSDVSLVSPLHVALVMIRTPQDLEDGVMNGIARTLSQLKHLGLNSIVMLDCEKDGTPSDRVTCTYQADRLVSAIQRNNKTRARRLDYVLGVSQKAEMSVSPVPVLGSIRVEHEDVLLRTFASGTIPVMPPLAYTTDLQQATYVQPDEVLLALTRHFVGLQWTAGGSERQGGKERTAGQSLPLRIKVDRIIVLDPLGGLPSASRPNKAHVFVNLEQEYGDIKQELQGDDDRATSADSSRSSVEHSVLGSSNPISQFTESAIASPMTRPQRSPRLAGQRGSSPAQQRHLQNLTLLRKSLSLLPSSSSALLTSPSEAATFRPSETSSALDLGVGTRRPRNPLIFNLLTDKPLVSSSLPVSRFKADDQSSHVQTGQATFVKRGMSLTMIPDPRQTTWEPPHPGEDCLSLEDPRIDFGRLLNLIEDSFNRPLNVEHYVQRIRNKLAGIIVAGEYEGGALLTWELPPGVPDDGSEASRSRMVPYLDKFAVLKRSQGGGGVADIVFSSMVRSCFPLGVCWRSRKDNPVNKWYFERSIGTLKLSESNWSMFWTTPGLVENKQRLQDYEGVCRSVQPSWADQKAAD